MTDDQRKEQISLAYLRAVAVAAGAQVVGPREIDDGCIDLSLEWADSDAGIPNIMIDLQLKATSQPREDEAGYIKHQITRRTWTKLTGARQKPHLFAVVALPADMHQSIIWRPDAVQIHRCAWWLELDATHHPFPADQGSMTLRLPQLNTLSPQALITLRERTATRLLAPIQAPAEPETTR